MLSLFVKNNHPTKQRHPVCTLKWLNILLASTLVKRWALYNYNTLVGTIIRQLLLVWLGFLCISRKFFLLCFYYLTKKSPTWCLLNPPLQLGLNLIQNILQFIQEFLQVFHIIMVKQFTLERFKQIVSCDIQQSHYWHCKQDCNLN